MEQFDDETFKKIVKAARETFNIAYPRPFQLLIIQHILESQRDKKRDEVLAVLPTGGGKSLCFLLPAVLLDGVTVLVFPILSLMSDQASRLERLNISYKILKGGMSWLEKRELFQALRRREAKILITDIEMLTQERILDELSAMDISLFVLDEAHTVISWGEGFRQSYRETRRVIDALNPKAVLAFTATLDKHTERRLGETVFSSKPYLVHGGMNRPNIIYRRILSHFPISDIAEILEDERMRPAIVFTRSRNDTEMIASRLRRIYDARHYHAGLDKKVKGDIESWFFSSPDGVLVSTIAYGMGVDKGNIRCVIHYSLPECAQDYMQETGRGGRDGKISYAYALIRPNEKSPLLSLFKGDECIRKGLLERMGKELDEDCTGCDACEKRHDASSETLEILRKVKRLPLFYTKKSLSRRMQTKKAYRLQSLRETEWGIESLIRGKKLRSFLSRLFIGSKLW